MQQCSVDKKNNLDVLHLLVCYLLLIYFIFPYIYKKNIARQKKFTEQNHFTSQRNSPNRKHLPNSVKSEKGWYNMWSHSSRVCCFSWHIWLVRLLVQLSASVKYSACPSSINQMLLAFLQNVLWYYQRGFFFFNLSNFLSESKKKRHSRIFSVQRKAPHTSHKLIQQFELSSAVFLQHVEFHI